MSLDCRVISLLAITVFYLKIKSGLTQRRKVRRVFLGKKLGKSLCLGVSVVRFLFFVPDTCNDRIIFAFSLRTLRLRVSKLLIYVSVVIFLL